MIKVVVLETFYTNLQSRIVSRKNLAMRIKFQKTGHRVQNLADSFIKITLRTASIFIGNSNTSWCANTD